MTGAFSPRFRASRCGSTAARRGGLSAALRISRNGETCCWRKRSASSTRLDRKIVAEEHWIRHGVSGRRKRNMRRVGLLQEMKERRRNYRVAVGNVAIAASAAAPSGALVIEAQNIGKQL